MNKEWDDGYDAGSDAQNAVDHRLIIEPLEAKVKDLKAALEKYGEHNRPCTAINDVGASCSCGFEQALKETEVK